MFGVLKLFLDSYYDYFFLFVSFFKINSQITLQRMEGCALTFSYQDLIGLSNVSTCLMQVSQFIFREFNF